MKHSKSKRILAGLASAVLIFFIVLGVNITGQKIGTDTVASSIATSTPVSTSTSTPTSTSNPTTLAYKNGTYTAVGQYGTPAGEQSISVTLTLQNDIISDATAEAAANEPQSARYQKLFITNFKQYVVGRSINSVKLNKVAGASLTPQGFNDAISKIKNESANV